GVGQYQHDVDQTKLKKSLDQTVENCGMSETTKGSVIKKRILAIFLRHYSANG
ncbi:RNA-binding protein, partial [Bacteroides fragilis]